MNAETKSGFGKSVESDRFQRHRLIEGFDLERVAGLRVALFGVGALGNEVLKNLALLGVGHVLICDFDLVEISNLCRSVLFREKDRGSGKASVAARSAREIHPGLSVDVREGDLHHEIGPGVLESFDAAIACVDSIDARIGITKVCLRAGIPYWNGGLGVSSCEISRYGDSKGPCYACGLGEKTLRAEAQRVSCQDGSLLARTPDLLPTTSLSASLGGALLVQDMLASILPAWRQRSLPPGTRLLLEAAPYRLTHFELARDPKCPLHEAADLPFKKAACTRLDSAAELLARTGRDLESPDLHLGFDLVTRWSCGCGNAIEKAVPLRAALFCQDCRQSPRDVETTTSLSAQSPLARRALGSIGVADGGELTLYDGRQMRTVRLLPERGGELP